MLRRFGIRETAGNTKHEKFVADDMPRLIIVVVVVYVVDKKVVGLERFLVRNYQMWVEINLLFILQNLNLFSRRLR